ncbi:cupin domain-containing protein [Woodsholea maritima]|uniref:cupin domain-containing protein n=1 Tax=Woodsholea maritima TaxID=240237 RepID=UPI00036817D6|nr:cupin domain-containing protein [Woodsholea maritima]
MNHTFPTGLDNLLAPITPPDFFAQYYEQKPLRLCGVGDGERFGPLLSLARIDDILASHTLHQGELDMARAHPPLRSEDFTSDQGIIDRGAVARHFQEGATIILPQLHLRERILGEFVRALEQDFSAHVQTNIYLTPANAQGFKTHYDGHDVFILQVEGRKRWRLYDSPIPTPYRGEKFVPGQFEPGEPSDDFVLEPGDVLYIPRGLMHDAISLEGEASLHITTGILVKTWADFMLEAVSNAALNVPALRRSLPPGFAREDFDRAQMSQAASAAFDGLKAHMDVEAVTDIFIDLFLRTRQADTKGALLASHAPITAKMVFQKRPLAQIRLADGGDHWILVAPGGDIRFDREAEAGLDLMLSGARFSLDAFEALSPERAKNSLKRLMAYGVIETLSP